MEKFSKTGTFILLLFQFSCGCEQGEWETVIDYFAEENPSTMVYPGGGFGTEDSVNLTVLENPSGTPDGIIVKRSLDNGTTWTDVPINTGFEFTFASTVNGSSVFFGGKDRVSDDWLVTRGSISDTTFADTRSDIYHTASGTSHLVTFMSAKNNLIVASGYGTDNGNNNYWIVRTSQDNGETWQLADRINKTSSIYAFSNAITSDSKIFVAGMLYDGSHSYWAVRRSVDLGATFESVEPAFETLSTSSAAVGIAADKNDNIYVAGYMTITSTRANWIVKKSTDSGATWTTVDNFIYSPTPDDGKTYSCTPTSIAAPGDKIFVLGTCASTDMTSFKFITRSSLDSGTTWETDDVNDVEGIFPDIPTLTFCNKLVYSPAENGYLYASIQHIDLTSMRQYLLVRKKCICTE
ncbi:MAG: exo-alpha-sialidase [Oligoflexia bacterium]|nr:exo-alpha-sialidase [Oligoflexia bacterium]